MHFPACSPDRRLFNALMLIGCLFSPPLFHLQYLYNVLKNQCSLPEAGLHMIRYHSFYPCVILHQLLIPFLMSLPRVLRWHREGAYSHLTNEADKKALAAVRAFNPYDLYSKSDEPVDPKKLKPYYQGLIAKFFPPVLDW